MTARARTATLSVALAVASAACHPRQPPGGGGGGGSGAGSDIGGATPDAGAGAAVAAPIPWSTAGVDWTHPPSPAGEPALNIPSTDELRLKNGLRVLIVRRNDLPLVSLELVNPVGGALYDPADRGGLAALTATLLDEGAGERDALALADELELLGAEVGTVVGANQAGVQLDTLASTLEASLDLLAEIVTEPRFAKKDFDRVKDDTLAALARRRDSARAIAPLVFEKLVYGAHAYARPAIGTADSLAKIGHKDVRRFYDAHWSPDRSTLVIAGDVDPTILRPIVERTIGRWKKRRLALGTPATTLPEAAPRLALIDKPGAPQAVVQLGRLALAFDDPRAPAATLANTLLGGSFTSLLNQRLREELGYTYGAGSAMWRGHGTGTWTISTALKTSNAIDGMREIFAILDRFTSAPPAAAELAKARQVELQELQAQLASNGGAAFSLAGLAAFDADASWWVRWAEALRAATADEVRDAARALLAREDLYVVVVGDLAVLREGLAELGLPPAVELGADGEPLPTP